MLYMVLKHTHSSFEYEHLGSTFLCRLAYLAELYVPTYKHHVAIQNASICRQSCIFLKSE